MVVVFPTMEMSVDGSWQQQLPADTSQAQYDKKMGFSSPLNINDSSRQQKNYLLIIVVFPTKEGSAWMRVFVDGSYLSDDGDVC